MPTLTYTPIELIPSVSCESLTFIVIITNEAYSLQIHAKALATFKTGRCRPLEYRRKQLYALVKLCQENVDAIAEALYKDLKKPRQEVLGFEVAGVVNQALTSAKNLEEWAKPEALDTADFYRPFKPTVIKTPKGAVLGIV